MDSVCRLLYCRYCSACTWEVLPVSLPSDRPCVLR
uniref:Uncharacterized protein n=1 Tax=Anguilla anguilla TaxID=7936 RepID=A0A0E9PP82_ANGAN